jgi:large conductance mechanosensitive channel
MLRGFIEFIRKQGVIGVAVAFILGGAVTKLVGAFVADFVNPLLGIFLGAAAGLSSASFSIAGATFAYGHFIMAVIDFAAIAFVVYFGVKLSGLEKLDKKD